SVLTEAMASRTREIGVRMALGATRAGIGRFVLRSGFMPAITGLAAGCVLTAVSVPALRSLLFGVSLLDLPTLAMVVVLLAGVTLAACAVPARRAMRMPVTTALRVECAADVGAVGGDSRRGADGADGEVGAETAAQRGDREVRTERRQAGADARGVEAERGLGRAGVAEAAAAQQDPGGIRALFDEAERNRPAIAIEDVERGRRAAAIQVRGTVDARGRTSVAV